MKVYAKAGLIIGLTSTLIGCGSSNVSSKWDCPKQEGYGCITIEEADKKIAQPTKSRERPLDIWVAEKK